jgi:hypothetical protein
MSDRVKWVNVRHIIAHSHLLRKNTTSFKNFCPALHSVSHCPVSDITQCLTLPSVRHYPLSDINQCPTLPSVWHYPVSHITLCPTLHSVPHCPVSDITQCLTLPSVWHYPVSNITLCPTLPYAPHYPMSHITLCPTSPYAPHYPMSHITLCPTLPYASHYPMPHITLCPTLLPHKVNEWQCLMVARIIRSGELIVTEYSNLSLAISLISPVPVKCFLYWAVYSVIHIYILSSHPNALQKEATFALVNTKVQLYKLCFQGMREKSH